MNDSLINLLTELHFIRPAWLLALLPLALAMPMIWRLRNRRGDWAEVCDPALLNVLVDDSSTHRKRRGLMALALVWMLTVIALAGPTWQQQPQPLYRNHAGRVVVVDLSLSMDATDIEPSRLARARHKAIDIFKQSRDLQTGLVVFAGSAFAVAPLTDDVRTLIHLTNALGTQIMPLQGGNPGLGIVRAQALLEAADIRRGDIILISDSGEDTAAVSVAARAADSGYRVSVLAIGTASGAPVPLAEGGFLKDDTGAIVMPALNTRGLKQIARAGNGNYLTMTGRDVDIAPLLMTQTVDDDEQTDPPRQSAILWQDMGPWLLLLVLPLAALSFRRGVIASVLLPWLIPVVFATQLCLFLMPTHTLAASEQTDAFSWSDLWQRPDQQAYEYLQKQDFDTAATHAHSPALRGSAEYRAGDYQAAIESFSQARQSADADEASINYNLGNALAKAGKLQDAVEAYEQALSKVPPENPVYEDARYNLELIQKLQDQQQNTQQGDQNPTQDGDGNNSDPQDASSGQQQPADNSAEDTPQNTSDDASDSQNAQSTQNQPDKEDAQRATADPSAEENNNENNENANTQLTEAQDNPASDMDRAHEQWLRRIPDDPGSLLRRKFRRIQARRGDNKAQSGGHPKW